MKFDSQTVSRIIFLLFIIIMSVYFMFVNKSFTENFVDAETDTEKDVEKEELVSKDKDTIIQTIKDIYLDIYQNDVNHNIPSQKAIDFYYDYASQRTITISEFKDVIQSSSPVLEKTLNDGEYVKPSTEVFGTEEDVQLLYNEILFRNPDENELYNFAKLLQTDQSFNIEKLKQILFTSDEYKRLEKTQSNAVYSNLIGGVTDRQLSLIITTIYSNLIGNEDIDTDTMKFLKKKLIEFNMNEDIFKQFLTNYIQNIPFNKNQAIIDQNAKIISNAQQQQQQQDNSTQQQQQDNSNNTGISKDDMEKFKQDILDEVRNSFKNIPKQEQSGYYTNGQEQTQVQNPNHQVIEILLRTAKEDQKESYLDSQNVLNQIKEQASCVFNKNASDNKYSQFNNKNTLANVQDRRNTEELRNTCVRNKKYLGIDEDMVLDPSLRWSIPQKHPPVCSGGTNSYTPTIDQSSLIGTLLADANESDNIIGQENPAI